MRILNILYSIILTGIVLLSFFRNVHEPFIEYISTLVNPENPAILSETIHNSFSFAFFSHPIPGLVYLAMLIQSIKMSLGKKVDYKNYQLLFFFLITTFVFLVIYFFIALYSAYNSCSDSPYFASFLLSSFAYISLILIIPLLVTRRLKKQQI